MCKEFVYSLSDVCYNEVLNKEKVSECFSTCKKRDILMKVVTEKSFKGLKIAKLVNQGRR